MPDYLSTVLASVGASIPADSGAHEANTIIKVALKQSPAHAALLGKNELAFVQISQWLSFARVRKRQTRMKYDNLR
jgi:hypothetical protein